MVHIKIAYLISAYKDPHQLNRMINALYQGENTYFFVHIDAKSNQIEFENRLFPHLKENVIFTPNRYWIQWGGFNQVRYQQELLRICIKTQIDFDRVFILTGQDYPLYSNEEINNEFKNNPHKEYIVGLDLTEVQNQLNINKRFTVYHYFRDIKHCPYKLKKIFSGVSRNIMTFLPIRKKNYIIIDNQKWHIYLSSSYMCITFNLAKYIYHKLETEVKLISYFKYSFVPEEMVIPTIIFNSSYRNNCSLYNKRTYNGLKYLSAITYFNYNEEIQTFTLANYDELLNSGKMFARKFSTGTSDLLMDKLEKEHGI